MREVAAAAGVVVVLVVAVRSVPVVCANNGTKVAVVTALCCCCYRCSAVAFFVRLFPALLHFFLPSHFSKIMENARSIIH